MNYPQTILWSSVIAAFCFTGAAYAQDSVDKDSMQVQKTDAAKTDVAPSFNDLLAFNNAGPQQDTSVANQNGQVQQLGTIQATGLVYSLKQSLSTKRSSNAIVDAITAKDIGELPATNVAEALSHVPGVQLDRNMPATERVSINGLDPNLNLTLLNGHPVAQAIWLFGASPSRGFNYSLLPSEIVGKIEVFKSYQASLPAGGLGGTIIVHTRDPLDVKANTISASVGYLYNAMNSEGKPNASVFYSTHNEAGSFGFNIGVQHFENPINRQGLEIFGYSPASAFKNATGDFSQDALVPQEVNSANFTQDLKRDSVYVNLQLKPSDAFTSALKVFYLKANLDSVNQSVYPFASSTADAVTSLTPGANGVVAGGSVTGVACTRDEFFADPANPGVGCGPATSYTDNFARGSEIKTKGADLQLAYTGDSWGISGQLGWNESNNTITQTLEELGYTGGYDFDTASGFTFHDQTASRDPDYWFANWTGNHILRPYKTRQNYAQVDFSIDLNSIFNKLLFGVRYAKHWESQQNFNYANGGPHVSLTDIGFGGITDLSGVEDVGGANDTVHHVQTSGFDAIENTALSSPVLQQNLATGNYNASVYYGNTWDVNQAREAAYAQLNFDNYYNLRGNLGLRFVHVKTVSHGFVVPAGCGLDCNFTAGTGYLEQERTSSDVLPAFNLAYTPAQDVVLRAAASETLGFSPYNQLVTKFVANGTTLTATANSPDIKPYKSVNFSLAAEWYFDPTGVLAVTLFNKNIINYIETKSQYAQHYNPLFSTPGANLNSSLIQDNCDMNTGVCRFLVTAPYNGGRGRIIGFTTSYQQAFGDSGFGLRANYTFADGSTAEGGRLPYNSKDSYSVSPFYAKGPINASITYNWRSDYTAAGYVAGAAPSVVDDYKSLSASFSYAFNSHWSLQFSGLNLLNSDYYQHNAGAYNELLTKYETGRLYEVSVHVKF